MLMMMIEKNKKMLQPGGQPDKNHREPPDQLAAGASRPFSQSGNILLHQISQFSGISNFFSSFRIFIHKVKFFFTKKMLVVNFISITFLSSPLYFCCCFNNLLF